jgi:hypothetical protein
LTLSVPPWLSAEHVLVHVTWHTAPDSQVTLDPSPTVTAQSLAASHVTLADAPALSVHVAWLWQSRLELSAATTLQLLCDPHVVLHEAPHAPVHTVADWHESMHPDVCAVHPLPPLKLQWPPCVQVHVAPLQLAGNTVPVDPEQAGTRAAPAAAQTAKTKP